eukprot:jgi/Mesen1/4242/ME000022S03538
MKCIRQCLASMGGHAQASVKYEHRGDVYRTQHMCNDTVWTLGTYSSLAELLKVIPESDGGASVLPFVVTNGGEGLEWPRPVNVVEALGAGSPASSAKFLALSSTFQPRIADFRRFPPAVKTPALSLLMKARPYLPPVPPLFPLLLLARLPDNPTYLL